MINHIMADYIYGLVQSTDETAINGAKIEHLSGIKVDVETPGDSDVYFVFKFGDGNWQTYSASSGWTDMVGELTAKNIASIGISSKDLKNFKSQLRAFCGRKTNYAVALKENVTDGNLPSFKGLSLIDNLVLLGNVTLSENELAEIMDIVVDKKLVGNGRAKIYYRTMNDKLEWESEYHELGSSTEFGKARAIKFYAEYHVDNIGTDAVTVNSIEVHYRTGNSSSGTTATCVTKIYHFDKAISNVHLVLKHPDVKDVTYAAYLSIRKEKDDVEVWLPMMQDAVTGEDILTDEFDYTAEDEAKSGWYGLRVDIVGSKGSVKDEALGSGTGAVMTYKLPHSARKKSIKVSPANASWNYDSKKNTIDITATAGVPITISYDWESEVSYLDSMSCIFSE